MDNNQLQSIINHFQIKGTVSNIIPLGDGLINDTYHVSTKENNTPDYVLQRINHSIFQDVDLLQNNIDIVTRHIRNKLIAKGETDINRKVLQFIPSANEKTYYVDEQNNYWRMSIFIPRSRTYNTIIPKYAYEAGASFGQFEEMLVDVSEPLGEPIPDFHNMELRIRQLSEAVANDVAGRVKEVRQELEFLKQYETEMCQAESLYREGKLPKRICHCDTKINNMLFDEDGTVLCVIDLDTVMPSFIFSDYGDFLRCAANTMAEDSPEYDQIQFRRDIFEAFTKGYLSSTKKFLTPLEIEMLPFAVALFPYMQAVRFLTDYINNDTYYKILYPLHNLVRTRNQIQFFKCIISEKDYMKDFIKNCN